MKILLIDVDCKNSSTGNIVFNLYKHINSLGDEASICYGRGELIKDKNVYKFGIDVETYIHAFLTRVTGYTGCYSFFSTRRLIRYIEEFNPDLVHIHELHAYFVNIKPLLNYLKRKKIKTVMTLHCEFAYTGKCGHSLECDQWKTQCEKCPHLRDYISTKWFDHTNYMFNQKKRLFYDFEELIIVTPSIWLLSRAKESFLKNHVIQIINNGIDINVFTPVESQDLREKLEITDDEKVVLALAPNIMSREKGGQFVEKIADLLSEENIRFLYVGTDDKEIVKRNNNIFIGKIKDNNLLAKFYSLADLFVICSERENYPTTCLEAQACGTPVYGFNTGGIVETCLDSSNLVKYGDIISLADRIKEADKKNKESIVKLSTAARDHFDNYVFLEKYYRLYKDFLSIKIRT